MKFWKKKKNTKIWRRNSCICRTNIKKSWKSRTNISWLARNWNRKIRFYWIRSRNKKKRRSRLLRKWLKMSELECCRGKIRFLGRKMIFIYNRYILLLTRFEKWLKIWWRPKKVCRIKRLKWNTRINRYCNWRIKLVFYKRPILLTREK